MKTMFLRSLLALLCAVSVASCGGNHANLQLGGSVSGLTKKGLTLSNNGGPALEIDPTVSTFVFPQNLAPDDYFDVEVKDQPPGAHCDLQYNKGRIGTFSLGNIQVFCYNIQRELSGNVYGLKNTGLVLNNGSVQVAVAPGSSSPVHFTFAVKDSAGKFVSGTVGEGETYGVTVLQQPQNQTCTVTNGTGTMGQGYDGVVVNCQ